MISGDFESFFYAGSGGYKPRPYQQTLADRPWPETLVVPTGFGKTAAVLGAWLWKLLTGDPETPRRLVYCLPMRTLVEQTARVAADWIRAAADLGLQVQSAVLMGGQPRSPFEIPEWMMRPEMPTILMGTQDMLVSAALMRGYGTNRYRWPVDFALLHNDAMWAFDEVQLAGSSLPTSAQLEAFRRRFDTGRVARTLWMSATLDPVWLSTVDFQPTDRYRPHDLSPADLASGRKLWESTKRLRRLDVESSQVAKPAGLKAYARAVAARTLEFLRPHSNAIVFVNTVGRAQALYGALLSLAPRDGGPEVVLVHSRFRRADRERKLGQILTPAPPAGRAIVATQALEAGIDISSAVMITELAPWSALVQRFGRSNRYGEYNDTGADVYWIDIPPEACRPYSEDEFAWSRSLLGHLFECGPAALSDIPPSPPRPAPVIRRRDLLDLFDTEPDLSGFDVDVSPYVRDADDTDVRLFWRAVPDGERPDSNADGPTPEELCPAPIGAARDLLRKKGVRAWTWDPLGETWRSAGGRDLYPGLAIWVESSEGGYGQDRGFDPLSSAEVPEVEAPAGAEPAMSRDLESEKQRVNVSLVKHTSHVRGHMERLATALALDQGQRTLLAEVALWHDLGKAHHAFGAPRREGWPPLAKWRGPSEEKRRYFRHELASALGYLERHRWSDEASLAAYLIAAHHGKVRTRICALPREKAPPNADTPYARGVWGGERIPATDLGGVRVPETVMHLDLMALGDGPYGPSWQERSLRLLRELGPFRLAWLEAVIRIADWNASADEQKAGQDDL